LTEPDSLFEKIIRRARNNRAIAYFLVLGTVVIGLATLTDSAKRIFEVIPNQSPEEARIELSKLSLAYSTDVFVERAAKNDLAAVKLFLAAGMDVNAKNGEDDTALTRASEEGNTAVVRTLLDAKANVDERDHDGQPALCGAAYNGRIDVVKLLLKYDTDRDSRNEALDLAALSGHMELLPVLRDASVFDRQAWTNALFSAVHSCSDIEQKCREGIKFLVDQGADVNARANPHDDDYRYTVLMWAIQRTDVNIAHDLMTYGADVNAKGTDGKTALMLAIGGGVEVKPDLIRDLLGHGAQVNEKDMNGNTPLSLANRLLEANHKTEVLRLLRGSSGH